MGDNIDIDVPSWISTIPLGYALYRFFTDQPLFFFGEVDGFVDFIAAFASAWGVISGVILLIALLVLCMLFLVMGVGYFTEHV